MQLKQLRELLIRYLFLLILALLISYSNIFYQLILNLTIYPLNFFLNFFYSSSIINNLIILQNETIVELIPACIAISAYLLLLILNLTTKMNLRKRIYSLLFSFFMLLILNIARIIVLSILLVENIAEFEVIHKFLWYGLSIFFVIGIWFLTAYVFKIKNIPVYTDIKPLLKEYNNKK